MTQAALLALLVLVPLVATATAEPGDREPWRDPAWRFRLPLTIGDAATDPATGRRVSVEGLRDALVLAPVDLTSALLASGDWPLDAAGRPLAWRLDPGTARVVETANGAAREVPSRLLLFEPRGEAPFDASTRAVGTLALLPPGEIGPERQLFLYFDLETAGAIAPPPISALDEARLASVAGPGPGVHFLVEVPAAKEGAKVDLVVASEAPATVTVSRLPPGAAPEALHAERAVEGLARLALPASDTAYALRVEASRPVLAALDTARADGAAAALAFPALGGGAAGTRFLVPGLAGVGAPVVVGTAARTTVRVLDLRSGATVAEGTIDRRGTMPFEAPRDSLRIVEASAPVLVLARGDAGPHGSPWLAQLFGYDGAAASRSLVGMRAGGHAAVADGATSIAAFPLSRPQDSLSGRAGDPPRFAWASRGAPAAAAEAWEIGARDADLVALAGSDGFTALAGDAGLRIRAPLAPDRPHDSPPPERALVATLAAPFPGTAVEARLVALNGSALAAASVALSEPGTLSTLPDGSRDLARDDEVLSLTASKPVFLYAARPGAGATGFLPALPPLLAARPGPLERHGPLLLWSDAFATAVAKPGETATATVALLNAGRGLDGAPLTESPTLEATPASGSSCAERWEASVAEPVLDALAGGSRREVAILVTVPATAARGSCAAFDLVATSSEDPSHRAIARLVVRARAAFEPALAVVAADGSRGASATFEVEPGGSRDVTLALANAGSEAGAARVAFAPAVGYAATLVESSGAALADAQGRPLASVRLAPGSVALLTLRVKADADAGAWDYHVQATSVDDPTQRAEAVATLVPRANATLLASSETAQLVVVPGGEARATIRLAATGGDLEARVRVASAAPAGWSIEANPARALLRAGAAQNVTLTARAPSNATVGTSVPIVLAADPTLGAARAARVPLAALVVNDFALRVAAPPSIVLLPASNATAWLLFENAGAGPFELVIASTVAPAGWNATLSRVPASLAPGESARATLRIEAPPAAPAGAHRVAFELRLADGVSPAARREVSIEVRVPEAVALAVEAPRATATLAAGRSERVAFLVANRGNAPAEVTLSATGGATLAPASLSLAAGETRAVEALVAAPRSPGFGEIVVTIEATARDARAARAVRLLEEGRDLALASLALRGSVDGSAFLVVELSNGGTDAAPGVRVVIKDDSREVARFDLAGLAPGATARHVLPAPAAKPGLVARVEGTDGAPDVRPANDARALPEPPEAAMREAPGASPLAALLALALVSAGARVRVARLLARPARAAVAVAALALGALAAGALLAAEVPQESLGAAPEPVAALDSDGDGARDLDEIARWGTSPISADSDGDSLPDAWEMARSRLDPDTGRRCPDPASADASRDCRSKGFPLSEDFRLGTEPWLLDSDGDAMPDAFEATHGMDATRADADADPFGDGLTNRERYALRARADVPDSACSGMTDAAKARLGLDVERASTGGSGVPDGYAIAWGLDPRDPAIGAKRLDGDPDGLTVLEKALATARALEPCATAEGPPAWERGLDPRKPDSEGDGLPDAWEARYGLDPLADDAPRDLDGDGLSNADAFRLGACPDKPDCDGDGLATRDEAVLGWVVVVDGVERRVYSDPARRVTDGDAIPDGAKRAGEWIADGRATRFAPLDPRASDTDGDGVPDAREVTRYSGVLDATRADSDGDGLPDGDEVAYWDARAAADPERADRLCALCVAIAASGRPNVANADADGDGLPDGEEVAPRERPTEPGAAQRAAFPATDPASADTDGDGLPDAWERQHARFRASAGAWDLDPARARSLEAAAGCPRDEACDDGARDLDGDALANSFEQRAGTDPHDADSDDDGLPDGWEWTNGAPGGARFAAVRLEAPFFEWLARAGEPVPLSPLDGSDAAATIARYAGALPSRGTWTFLDAFALGVSPVSSDADGDGVADLWAAAWKAGDASSDPDGDGLANAAEFAFGTSPLASDTDGGGLPDGVERDAGTAPRDPRDDAADGDLDGDGVANAIELSQGTRVDRADTDGDGLLDGETISLAFAASPETRARIEALRAAGVARRENAMTVTFLGESEVTRDTTKGCALKLSCALDGLPDGWKVWHGLDALAFRSPLDRTPDDGLTLHEQYAWGRPAGWNESERGTWWLGLDPTRADTDRDGVRDDRETKPQDLADLDNDGLNDLAGEDPFPFADRENAGFVAAANRTALFDALLARARIPRAPAVEPLRIHVDTALPAEIDKSGALSLTGRVRLANGAPAPARVPLLARFATEPVDDPRAWRTDSPASIAGIAFTDATGAFALDLRFERAREVAVPDGVASLLSAPPPPALAWSAEGPRLGDDARVVLWAHGDASGDAQFSGNATFVAGVARVVSKAAFAMETPPAAPPGEPTAFVARLVDAAGDEHAPERAGLVEAEILGRSIAPTTMRGANATFRVTVPLDAAAAPIPLTLRFAGDERLRAGATTIELLPRIASRLTVVASAPNATIGGAIALAGRLTDARGAAIAGEPVEVALGSARARTTTDERGEYAATVPLPATATPGARAPSARYAGTSVREAASANGTAVLVQAASRFANLSVELALAKGGEARGALLVGDRPARDPLTGQPPIVRVSVAGLAIETSPDSIGRFRAKIPPEATARPGRVAILVESEGSRLVLRAHETLDAVVHTGTRMTLAATRLPRGVDGLVEGALRDDAGAPVAWERVAIAVDGARVTEAVTDERGAFRAVVRLAEDAPLGRTSIGAAFAGDEARGPARADAVGLVVATPRIEVVTFAVSSAAPRIDGRLLVDGEPSAGAALSARVNGGAPRPVVTRADGTFLLALSREEIASGEVSIALGLAEEPDREAASAEWRLLVERTTTTSVSHPGALVPGRVATLAGTIVDDAGRPVAGARALLALRGAALGAATTDAAGAWRLDARVPGESAPGPAILTARFEGRPGALASATDVLVPVRAPASLTLAAPARVEEGAALDVVALASGASGAPLAGEPVLFEVPGYDVPLRAVTDAEGRAGLSLPARASGPLTATLAATDARSEARETRELSIAEATGPVPANPPLVPLAIGAASALLLAAFAWRRARAARGALAADVALALGEAERRFVAPSEDAASVVAAYATLADALARRALLDVRAATPREVERALAAAFPLDARDLDRVVAAFEAVRYGGEKPRADEAADVVAALARLRSALGGPAT